MIIVNNIWIFQVELDDFPVETHFCHAATLEKAVVSFREHFENLWKAFDYFEKGRIHAYVRPFSAGNLLAKV